MRWVDGFAPALDIVHHVQARGLFGAIGHGILVVALVIFVIGLVVGIAIGFFIGRAVGRGSRRGPW